MHAYIYTFTLTHQFSLNLISNFLALFWVQNNAKKHSMNLLAIAVGIKQKENVNKMVKKVTNQSFMPFMLTIFTSLPLWLIALLYPMWQFPSTDFIIMLFHYDGIVDEWGDLEWSQHAIHVSAINQTKW